MLVTLNAVIDSVLGLVIALVVVSRIVRRQWTKWLESKDSIPYMDRVAERVIAKAPPVPSTEDFMAKLEPRLNEFEERLNQPVQIDLAPIVSQVTNNILPGVREEIDRVRAFIDGKIGWGKKVAKNTGEAIAEMVGEGVAEEAGVSGAEGEIMAELDGMLQDSEWVKEHRVAAFGLRLLKGEYAAEKGGVTLNRGNAPGQRGLMRLRGRRR